jgi:lysylphosphatidylglycerol synthetase-like protein (DUF2156 family)
VNMQWKWQFVVAGMLIVAFAVLTFFMLSWADAPAEEWKNLVFVFSSVEAIVFTAVGWLFGREVHREGAETARKDAAEAQDKADANQREAADEKAKGMRLAGAVEAMDGTTTLRTQGEGEDVGFAPADAGLSQVDRVRQLARDLYPPR